ncbi:aldehyde dehydrogenase family protein [Nonomuraea sp. NPDC049158]|uniref:aldehyde dehydrogenase family protein n=1 Tax=Nonomuraea sp. NPDC049158 TaxID=3155649 RepID=UPI0033C48336
MHVTSSGKTTEITAPFTGEPLADLPVSGVDDVHEAYRKARAAQAEWAALPACSPRAGAPASSPWPPG